MFVVGFLCFLGWPVVWSFMSCRVMSVLIAVILCFVQFSAVSLRFTVEEYRLESVADKAGRQMYVNVRNSPFSGYDVFSVFGFFTMNLPTMVGHWT